MILGVPYYSQLSPTALLGNDCGQASVLMLLRFYGRVAERVTVDMLSRDTYGKTTGVQLCNLASRYDLPLVTDQVRDPEQGLRESLAAGHPVIILVDYIDLAFPIHLASGADQGWHWFVIIGYDDAGNWVVHDPLWHPSQRAGRGGAELPLSSAILRKAYRGQRVYAKQAAQYLNPTRKTVIVTPEEPKERRSKKEVRDEE